MELLRCAGTQVQFELINAANPLEFDLAGPNGYTHPMLHNGDFLTLPSGGNYVLSVSAQGQQLGIVTAYSFRQRLATVTTLTLGTPFVTQLHEKK